MNRHLATGLVVVGAVAAALFTAPQLAKAQGQSNGHAVVVQETNHAHTGPLRGIRPIPPPNVGEQEIPVRHPKPAQARSGKPDPALQTSTGPLVSTTSGIGFLGLGVGFNGATGDNYAPPDTNGSAGATQYVQWVNVSFAVFNKSTGALEYGPASGNTLWNSMGGACASNNSGDPIAQYDKQAQRWVLMQPVFTSPYYMCVAVSQTSDATGIWNLYQFATPNNTSYFPDYPKLAVWPDGYYVSWNNFSGNSFVGGEACALNRSAMLAGTTATMQCFNSGYPSLLPGDLDGDSGASGSTAAPPAGSPDYFIDFNGSSLLLWKFHVDWNNPSNTTFTGPAAVANVASFSPACGGGTCVPQPSTNEQLDSLGDRLMYRFSYRNFGSYESLLASQSVDTGNGNTGVRWYEIRSPGSSPTVYQQGTFAPDSNYRWMPSIAQDEKGDIALGYSESSSGLFPQIDYTGRQPSDTLGTMETEATIQNGSGSQLPNLSRWGDYSNMSVDPSDDCTFWYTTEFLKNSGTFNWSTQIASFIFPGCTAPPSPDFSLSASGAQTVRAGGSAGYTLTVTPSNGYTGNVTLSLTGTVPTGVSATFSPNPVLGGSGTSNMTVQTSSTTPAGTYSLTVQGTDGTLTHTTTVSLTVQVPDFTISASPSSQTVTQGGGTTYTVNLGTIDGYSGSVTLSASGLPSGASASFSPNNPVSVSGSGTSEQMSVTTSGTTPAGTYPITITGQDLTNHLTHSTSVTLVVQAPAPDFTISANPTSLSVPPRSSGSTTITITGVNSFNGTVSLSVSGLPRGVSASFSPSSVTGSGSSKLTITSSKKPQIGTFTLTIKGTSGSLNHSTTVQLKT